MLSVLLQTIFSFTSYHRLSRLGAWKTFFYSFYIFLLGLLVFNIFFSIQVNKHLPAFLRRLPPISLDKGTLTEPKEPVSITIPGTDFIFKLDAQNAPKAQDFSTGKLAAVISGNTLYAPGINGGMQTQNFPPSLTVNLNQDTLAKYTPALRSLLRSAVFFGSAVAFALFLLFSCSMAGSVICFWAVLTANRLPAGVIVRWAILLQGPALVLWMVHLFWGVPLFLFGLLILFIIYTQQIFNTLPTEDKR